MRIENVISWFLHQKRVCNGEQVTNTLGSARRRCPIKLRISNNKTHAVRLKLPEWRVEEKCIELIRRPAAAAAEGRETEEVVAPDDAGRQSPLTERGE